MGAFDTVNIDKYSWYRDGDSSTAEQSANWQARVQFAASFVGPVYSGGCIGNCVSTRCVACAYNRRVDKEYLDTEIRELKRSVQSFTSMGRPDLADKKRKNFERYFPGVLVD